MSLFFIYAFLLRVIYTLLLRRLSWPESVTKRFSGLDHAVVIFKSSVFISFSSFQNTRVVPVSRQSSAAFLTPKVLQVKHDLI